MCIFFFEFLFISRCVDSSDIGSRHARDSNPEPSPGFQVGVTQACLKSVSPASNSAVKKLTLLHKAMRIIFICISRQAIGDYLLPHSNTHTHTQLQ